MLSARVEGGSWNRPIAGDPEVAGTPSGPLWGRGRLSSDGDCLQLEQRVLSTLSNWCDGLEHVGLSQERRALVLRPMDFAWQQQDDQLELSFSLPPGAYATAILREISKLKEMSAPADMV